MEETIHTRDSDRQQIKEKRPTVATTRNIQIHKVPFCPLYYLTLKSGNTKCWQGLFRKE